MTQPAGPVVYVLGQHPVRSQTFIEREIAGLEAAGQPVVVTALRRSGVAVEGAHPSWAPPTGRLAKFPRYVVAHAGLLRRWPRRWVAALVAAVRGGVAGPFLRAGPIARHVAGDGVRHVHAHFAGNASDTARQVALLLATPCTVTVHAADIYKGALPERLPARLAAMDAVVTVSEHNRDHLASLDLGVPVHLVRNAVEPITGGDDGGRDDGLLVTACRLIEKKGVDLAIAALADVPGARLQVIGDGPLRADLEQAAAAAGVADRTTFSGWMAPDDARGVLARATAVVMPCRIAADGDRDGLPTVIVEAMAEATPVVATDVVGIGEVVVDGVTGRLVPPDDVAALAAACADLVADADERRRLGRAGRDLIARDYAPARSAADLLDVFAAAAAAAAARRRRL